ncbi:MAG: prephenate dehydratase [Thermomicrobiales bacterium]
MERSARPSVAYQGEHGAYSEEAALTIFGAAETVGCPNFAAAFDAVLTGQADFATIPVENSQAGSINDTYDLLLTHRDRLTVRGEFDLHVHHCLLALPEDDPATLQAALSHPQALAQTMGFLTQRGLKPIVSADTAGSARLVREDAMHGYAAVAGRRAAEFYNLRIVAANIEDNPYNFTKFLVLAPHATPIEPATFALPPVNPAVTKTALLFAVDNVPGSLYRALGALAENGLNMTKIESRPARQRPWDYNFYADVEGDISSPHYQAALDALADRSLFLSVLGSYHVLRSARELGNRG